MILSPGRASPKSLFPMEPFFDDDSNSSFDALPMIPLTTPLYLTPLPLGKFPPERPSFGLTMPSSTAEQMKPHLKVKVSPGPRLLKGSKRNHTGNKASKGSKRNHTEDKASKVSKRNHTEDKAPKLDWCYMCDKMVHDLPLHCVNHHPKSDVYNCPNKGCVYTSKHKHRIRLHNSVIHYGIKEFGCPRPDCTFRGAQQSDVTRHAATHSTEKKFECEVCHKLFKRETSKVKHFKRYHHAVYARIRPFQCPLCDMRYTTKAHLINHIENEHI